METRRGLENQKVFTVNIDHHISNTGFGELNFVDAEASSASELVYRLLDGWCEMDAEIACAIYTGIIFDTACFKHSSTTPLTMSIAGELMKYGIPFTEIQEKLFYSHTFVEARLLAAAIKSTSLECGGRLAVSNLSIEEIELNGGTSKDVDAIVSYIKNTTGVDAAAFFYEKRKGEIKASMRSNEAVNVSEIAVKFGGGGHVRATVLGAMEVAENGDLANWIVPGKKVSGMGGAMDLCTGCPEVIIVMLHTNKGKPKILKKCSLPLTAEKCVSKIITEMGVMEVREDGIWVVELHPDYTKEDIQAATECELHFDPDMKAMEEE